jgi:hypothetical protein
MKIQFFLGLESVPSQTGVRILTKTVKVLQPANWTILTIDAYGIGGQCNDMVRVKDGMWIQLEGLVPVPGVDTLGRLIREILEAEKPTSSGE